MLVVETWKLESFALFLWIILQFQQYALCTLFGYDAHIIVIPPILYIL